MNVKFAPRGILQIDDARIVYRNFTGTASQYNREGDRNFALVIPDQELADSLMADNWNVKVKPPRDEDDTPFMFLNVKVKFNERGPAVYLKTGNAVNRLDKESVSILDNIDILSVDMDIRPYDWNVNGKDGRTAYLQSIYVTQDVDRFAERYGNMVAESNGNPWEE